MSKTNDRIYSIDNDKVEIILKYRSIIGSLFKVQK